MPSEKLARSKFRTELQVRPDDIDRNQHVHYSRYFDYVLAARYDQMGRCYGMAMEEFVELGFGWVVKFAHLEFKRPLNLGDTIVVTTWIEEMFKDGVKVQFDVGRLLAVLAILTACATPPPTAMTRFPSAAELRISPRDYQRYERAATDFQRMARGGRPKYATMRFPPLRDGGTTVYNGEGYQLTAWKRLLGSNTGVTRIYVGPEIVFEHSLSPRGPIHYSAAHLQNYR